MKIFFFISLALSSIIAVGQKLKLPEITSICKDCNAALIQDYSISSTTLYVQLALLNIVDETTFKILQATSKSGGDGGLNLFGVIKLAFQKSDNYEQFQEERRKYFSLYQYNSTQQQSQLELKYITKDIQFTEWGKCIKLCYDADERKSIIYGFVEQANEYFIKTYVKYKGNATSVASVNCTVVITNGKIKIPDGPNAGSYAAKYAFSLVVNGDKHFTVERINKEKPTVITINSGTTSILNEVSGLKKLEPLTATLKYARKQLVDTFSRNEILPIPTPNAHNINQENDLPKYIDCSKAGGRIINNDKCFLPATKSFPVINSNEEYYNHIEHLTCKIDNQGACEWGGEGLSTKYIISPDGKSAKIEFLWGTRDVTLQSVARVYKRFIRNVAQPAEPIYVEKNSFIVAVPNEDDVVEPLIILKIDEQTFTLVPGESRVDLNIILQGKPNPVGNKTYYEYKFKPKTQHGN
jgi:hypothetical protein